MARQISSVRIQLHYRRGARLFWRAIDGPMPVGLQNGYAVTAFESELELCQTLFHFKYSDIFQQCRWKVGTAETTKPRLDRMFGGRAGNLYDPALIWDRYYIPLVDRLSKYQGDTKSLEAGQCAWMRDVLLPTYNRNGRVAILMVPLILGYKGLANHLEEEMSDMIANAGGEVINDKKKQNSKERKESTDAQIGLPDNVGVDKMLKLTPTLQKLKFELHPEHRRRK